eukprot:scaffold50683_cov52-Phaeocystis_antarctica.AAC.6
MALGCTDMARARRLEHWLGGQPCRAITLPGERASERVFWPCCAADSSCSRRTSRATPVAQPRSAPPRWRQSRRAPGARTPRGRHPHAPAAHSRAPGTVGATGRAS